MRRERKGRRVRRERSREEEGGREVEKRKKEGEK